MTVLTVGVGQANKYGTERRTVTDQVQVRGLIQQVRATEVTVDREVYTSEHRAFLPADTVIGAWDRIVCDGQTYEVIGQPHIEYNPRAGRTIFIEANLRLISEG